MAQDTLSAAFLITSKATREARKHLVSALDATVGAIVPVQRVECDEPEDVLRALAEPGANKIVDVNAATLDDEGMRAIVRPILVRQLSNAGKHLEALKRISSGSSSSSSSRFALVVEDDVLFGSEAAAMLSRTVQHAPADADIVFLGLPSARTAPAPTAPPAFDDPLQLFAPQVIPACDSYLVTAGGAARLAAAFLPVRFPTNVHLTYLVRKGVVKAYVAVPNVFVDGSKVGAVCSALEANNKLSWNSGYCKMDVLVHGGKACEYGAEEQALFERLWNEQPFKDHPDCLVLRADHLARCGKHAEADDAYTAALTAYDRQGCIVNSSFLKRHMALYKHL